MHSAECHYKLKRMKEVFVELRTVTGEIKGRANRSKMYSVFSAWKFHTKERRLLKKYLKECNFEEDYLSVPSKIAGSEGRIGSAGLSMESLVSYGGVLSEHKGAARANIPNSRPMSKGSSSQHF